MAKPKSSAVCVGGRVPAKLQEADIKHFILKSAAILGLIILLVIALTNAVLTRWITKMIMTPLDALRDGTHRIAEGDLDSPIAYSQPDEFGAVCQDFEGMRHQLKTSVDGRMQAEQHQKEWLAGISHDLRTPLTSIIGYVEGLQDGIANTDEIHRVFVNLFENSVKYAKRTPVHINVVSSVKDGCLSCCQV